MAEYDMLWKAAEAGSIARRHARVVDRVFRFSTNNTIKTFLANVDCVYTLPTCMNCYFTRYHTATMFRTLLPRKTGRRPEILVSFQMLRHARVAQQSLQHVRAPPPHSSE